MGIIIQNYKLERIDPKFYQELFSWRSDSYAMEYNPFIECDFEAFCKKYDSFSASFDQLYDGSERKWAIVENDIPIAMVGLSAINKMMKTAEIGYQVNPKLRMRGIGTAVVYFFVQTIFASSDLRKLSALIASDNIPSRKIVEKIGFKLEGMLRKHFIIQGKEKDEAFYGIFKEEILL